MATSDLLDPLPAHSNETRDFHRAVASLMEELDAIDRYAQRAELCTDTTLRAILVHNKHEEIEHAMMLVEWLRRVSPTFDHNASTFLFKTGPIAREEVAADLARMAATLLPGSPPPPPPGEGLKVPADGSLGLGNLRVAAWTA